MLLRAGFDTVTGYGNDGVDMAVALENAGVDVRLAPTSVRSGLPPEFLRLLLKEPEGPFDVALNFAPPYEVQPAEFAGTARLAVGWSMWEKSLLTRDDMRGAGWTHPHNRKHWWSKGPLVKEGRHKNWLDLMVVTCPDNVAAFQHLDPHLPYAVVPNGIDPKLFPVMERERGGPMVFASIGMLNGRKDPFATLAAWERAQQLNPGFDARLVLKTSTTGLHPKIAERYRNVAVITDEWPRAAVVEFYRNVDVLVSSSRGEGNNKPAMEFMSTGGPVMATDWSGHRNWLHEAWGYPLSGELEPVADGSSVMDFRVNVEQMAGTFLHCWANPEEVRRKGELAAQYIRQDLSWARVAERLLYQIGRVS
jgi:glycosyltransferase involved in cell wall biosynthesis